ncbi:MAG: DUF1801 domain-containing protein [Ekhidna sp.]|nr:DUF1801 domain-containing protein [Ekhidna sp.]
MYFEESDRVREIIAEYPEQVSRRLLELKELILEVARENDIEKLLETTKWGEPSYVAKGGSTIRIDWKPATPDKYFIFFICSTQLVSTFRFIIGDEMTFIGNRAIELDINDSLPIVLLKRCIALALNYHQLKDLPMLGQ